MAIWEQPEASTGILGSIKSALGLFGETNKQQGATENSQTIPIDEYESSYSETKVIELVSQWKRMYSVYYTPVDASQQLSFNYWIGKQRKEQPTNSSLTVAEQDITDNLIFEAVETFLPIATRANPDPLVSADPSDIGQQMASDMKVALVNWADEAKLRRKLARMVRGWALNRLGTLKIIWNSKIGEIECEVINTRRMYFDPYGHINESGKFVGEWLGEKKKASAKTLMTMFPKKKADIMIKAGGKEGTMLDFCEWWYRGTDVFFTLDELVLSKNKNPNWNYDIPGQEGVEPETDEEGNVITEGQQETEDVQGTNHLKEMRDPYVFLSVFSTGLHPHDDTSLILQNVSIQDEINRTGRQISKNVQGMNNGMVVSGRSFTEDQAAQASSALMRGVSIRVPDGDVDKAVKRFPPTAIPADVFHQRDDQRSELRNIFGTSGSTPQGTQDEETVRGKVMVQQQDSSRIGGGITEQIEQVADTVYNEIVQFMFVWYDKEHFVTTAGSQGGAELITIKNTMFPLVKTLSVTVKEGSLVPKDPLTQRNEAVDLWSQGAIDPFNFYKKLDFPDPAEATQQLILWQMLQKGVIQPQQYLPSFQIPQQQGIAGAMPPPPGVGGPAVSPPGNQGVENQPTPQQSQPAVQEQEKQLLQAAPKP
jgi:hypothetical protein